MADPKILIIDDDVDLTTALAATLESQNYSVDTAGDETWLPVDGFLDKPVEPDTLLAEVKKLLPG